ncbi:uncharacterized protein [Nicotiana sylvestris]|uniref:uncharacterized protein n=1 Tax=Nicotiana sylvestris TaxID=4096 RepID=UPI00388C519E
MSGYAKFMKDLVTKKRSMNFEIIKMTHQVSTIVHSIALKLEDPGAFTIPYTIGSANFAKALLDLVESINLIPYFVFKILGIGQPRPTSMKLQMADRTMKRPLGIIDDVLVRVNKFILPADFMVVECEVDYEVPIILERPFLDTRKALVDVKVGELTFRVEALNWGASHIGVEALAFTPQSGIFHPCGAPNEEEGNRLDIPNFCMHKIILEEDAKPSVENQRKLNEAMQEAVKQEIIK